MKYVGKLMGERTSLDGVMLIWRMGLHLSMTPRMVKIDECH